MGVWLPLRIPQWGEEDDFGGAAVAKEDGYVLVLPAPISPAESVGPTYFEA